MTDQPRSDDIVEQKAAHQEQASPEVQSGPPPTTTVERQGPPATDPGGQAAPQLAPAGMSKSDEKTWGVVMHLGSLILGIFPILSFIVPLIVWLINKDRSRMLNDHGRSALNWSITYIIMMTVFGALTAVYIGALLLPLGFLAHVILCIIAAVKAGQRRKFKHPMTIPFLRVG
ncbi:DUF4870 domain-containing protein [Nesterenkonia sp. NBAIMH1]|uniref:DUF4870 domain-containing protein n=1 Tax=Nesterenkonia sp. NBAIMH1 TaxID=2600320 RepID=UPI0011B51E89|nr:DUF4870 domain-containing protein [Nesterenkonia sp. NBAIMH1]